MLPLVAVAVTPAVAGVLVMTSRLMPLEPPAERLMAPPVTLLVPLPLPSTIEPANDLTLTAPVLALSTARVTSPPVPAVVPALTLMVLLLAEVSMAAVAPMVTAPAPAVGELGRSSADVAVTAPPVALVVDSVVFVLVDQ